MKWSWIYKEKQFQLGPHKLLWCIFIFLCAENKQHCHWEKKLLRMFPIALIKSYLKIVSLKINRWWRLSHWKSFQPKCYLRRWQLFHTHTKKSIFVCIIALHAFMVFPVIYPYLSNKIFWAICCNFGRLPELSMQQVSKQPRINRQPEKFLASIWSHT